MQDGDIDCAWTLTTAPVLKAFTVQEAKAQIRSVQDKEDGVVLAYIKAATALAEEYLGRGLLTQSWTFSCDRFADFMPLPMAAPLQSVTSVKYYDATGIQQTLANTNYTVDTRSRPGQIALAANLAWPTIQSLRKVNRVEVEYVVGWTSAELIPESIRQGMRVCIGAMDADRDGMDPQTPQAFQVAKLFWTDRVFWKPPCWVKYY